MTTKSIIQIKEEIEKLYNEKYHKHGEIFINEDGIRLFKGEFSSNCNACLELQELKAQLLTKQEVLDEIDKILERTNNWEQRDILEELKSKIEGDEK